MRAGRLVTTGAALWLGASGAAYAQGLDAAAQFTNQCATCHTLDPSEPQRQGPTLAHVVGRKIGSIDGYAYTKGYREAGEAGQVWDEARLDEYLQNPQKMFPGSTMAYKQSRAAVRQQIIAYLKEKG